MLDAFAKKNDPYVLMAMQIYRKIRDDITKDERFLGKQAVLGCGYGMGPDKFIATCDKLSGGKTVPDRREAQRIVDMYRDNRPEVVQFWRDIETAFHEAMDSRPNQWYQGVRVGGVPYIRGKLPSGRWLYYAKPSRAWEVNPKNGKSYLTIRYWGQNTYTRQWEMVKTYGGKLVENMVQAISRDILGSSMLRLEEHEHRVVLQVHDEIVSEDDGAPIEEFKELMEHPPEWAKGLPVEVEVFRCARYRK